MASPQDILTLMENSHNTGETTGIDISTIQSDCHRYKFSFVSSCSDPNTIQLTNLYVDADFNSLQPDRSIEQEQKRDGTVKLISMRLSYIMSMELVVNDQYFFLLDQAAGADTIKIQPINPDGTELEIEQATWEVVSRSNNDSDTYVAVISFKLKDTDRFITPCCPATSIITFENPCDDGEGGGGDPVPDPCLDYAVSIDFDGTTFSPNITGGPAGATTTYRWLKDSGTGLFVEISTAGSVNESGPGIYRLIATRGTCQASYDYEYQGDCGSFAVTLAEPVDGFIVATPNRTSTFTWEVDTGSGYVALGDTTAAITALVDGTYRVTATSNGCTAQATIAVTLEVCAHSVTIARNGNTLETTVVGNTGAPTYQWYADYGDGSGLQTIVGATGPDYPVTVPGCYEVKVTADGCDKYAMYLVLDTCVGFNVLIESVVPAVGSTVDLTATVTNPPAAVTYTWYQISNGVWNQIGTGASINIGTTGTVRVVAESGACSAEDILSFCVEPGVLENYQAFIGDNVNTEWTVTNFTLPNPAGLTENQINGQLIVRRNGVELQYSDTVGVGDRTQYTIDFANNQVELATGWPLEDTERLEVLLLV